MTSSFIDKNIFKITLIIIGILVVWVYIRDRNNKKLLDGPTKTTIGFITDITKGTGVRTFPSAEYYYYVKGEKYYNDEYSNFNIMKIGDTILIKYAISNPSVSEVLDKYYMKIYAYKKH